MRVFLSTFVGCDELKDEVARHLISQGLTDPVDLGFLCNAGGGVSDGLMRKGCPSSWGTDHFDILCRAVERQTLIRQGVVNLSLLSLDALGGEDVCEQAPDASVSKRMIAPPCCDTPRPLGKEGGLRSKPLSVRGVSASAFTLPHQDGEGG